MAYLDDELAAEERHELEAHLTECTSCRSTLERERVDRSMLRRALVAPPASEMLRARLVRALDEQDRSETKEQRRRWTSYLLPSSAIAGAAAAIALFVATQAPVSTERVATNVAHDAVKHGTRTLPLEVEGPNTGPWLRQHFANVQPPEMPDTHLIGGRLLPGGINGHDAALMSYQVYPGDRPPFVVSVLAVHDLRDDEMRDGTPLRVNGRTLYVHESARREVVVTYVAPNNVGFMFVAPELSMNELIGLVSRANLVAPR